MDVLSRRIERESDDVELAPVIDRETLLTMQAAIEGVHVAASVREYCVDLVIATRDSKSAAVGASPRGSLALLKLSRCRAALHGRDFVLPDDVKAIAVPALAHRLVLRPELWVQQITAEDVVRDVLEQRPDPSRGGRPADRTPMRRAGNPRLLGYAALAAIGMVSALALRRPELAIIAGPFALVLVGGTRGSDPGVEAELALDAERTLEGSEIEAVLTVRAQRSVDRVELMLELPHGMEEVDGAATRSLRLRAGEERGLPFVLRCTTWGVYEPGDVSVRARDAFRLATWESTLDEIPSPQGVPEPDHAAPTPGTVGDAGLPG